MKIHSSTHPHRLFVYGTLKRPWGNHRLLVEHKSRFIGDATTLEQFVLTDGFPYVWKPSVKFRGIYTDYLGQVVGELYAVTHEGLAAVDRLEGHPNYYRRTPIQVVFGPEDDQTTVTAGIYLRQESIDPSQLAEPRKGLLEWGTERLQHLERLHPQFERKES